MKRYKTIIFDFDGTIADSLYLVASIYNQLATKHGLPRITRNDILYLRSLGAKEALRYMAIPYYKLPFMLLQARSLYVKNLQSVEAIVGIEEVIQALSRKYRLGILTSNDTSTVSSFLAAHKLEVFDWIITERNIFGKHHSLRKILKQYSLNKKDVVYVGDEVRDVKSCHKAGMDVVAVSWGFNNEVALQKQKPTYLATSPDDLYTIFKVV